MEVMDSKLEAALAKMGRSTVVDAADADEAFAPKADVFYNEQPRADFKSLGGKKLFESNLLLNENDDSKVRRLERVKDVLVYMRLDIDGGGTYYVTGQALQCAEGSAAERKFIQAALADVMQEAAEPLTTAMDAMREAGLRLDAKTQKKLLQHIVSQGEAA